MGRKRLTRQNIKAELLKIKNIAGWDYTITNMRDGFLLKMWTNDLGCRCTEWEFQQKEAKLTTREDLENIKGLIYED